MQMSCSRCGTAKEFTAEFFVPSPICRDGLSHVCRTCRAAYHREWKASHSEAYAARRRALYAAHPDREKARTRQRELMHWMVNPHRARARILAGGIRERARNLGLPLDSILCTIGYWRERLLRQPNCECCKRPFQVDGKVGERSGPSQLAPSVDRILPHRGYVESNVALICWRCNNLKRDATWKELSVVARWLRGKVESDVEILRASDVGQEELTS